MFENSASSRMQLVGVGDLRPPGSCLVCGNGTRQEGYIDLGVSYDYVGNLYLCWFCVVESAEILGCMIPSEVKHLKESYDELAATKARMEEELDSANERLKAFDLLLNRDDRDFSTPTVVGTYSPDEVDATSGTDNGSGESAIDGEQSVVSESTESGGPSNVSEPELLDVTAPGRKSGLTVR